MHRSDVEVTYACRKVQAPVHRARTFRAVQTRDAGDVRSAGHGRRTIGPPLRTLLHAQRGGHTHLGVLLSEGTEYAVMVELLAEEYDAPFEVIAADTRATLAALVRARLVRPRDGGGPPIWRTTGPPTWRTTGRTTDNLRGPCVGGVWATTRPMKAKSLTSSGGRSRYEHVARGNCTLQEDDMVERSKRAYSPPALEDRGRITEQTVQPIHRSPEATGPVQPTPERVQHSRARSAP